MSLYLTWSFPVTASARLVSVPRPMLVFPFQTVGVSHRVLSAVVLKTSSSVQLFFVTKR